MTNTEVTRVQTGVEVELLGQDGNAFMLLGLVQKALRRHKDDLPAGVTPDVVMADLGAAESYDDLLQRIMSWVEVV